MNIVQHCGFANQVSVALKHLAEMSGVSVPIGDISSVKHHVIC